MKTLVAVIASAVIGGGVAWGASFGLVNSQNPDVAPGSRVSADGEALTQPGPIFVGYEEWPE